MDNLHNLNYFLIDEKIVNFRLMNVSAFFV